MDNLLEKVIKGLECCYKDEIQHCNSCPYVESPDDDLLVCTGDVIADALSLLKAQEPRVMTLEEVAKWIDIPDESKDPIFVEYGRKMKFGHSGWRTQFFGFSPKFHAKIYGVELRCWTSRPTEEQRKAVKWK